MRRGVALLALALGLATLPATAAAELEEAAPPFVPLGDSPLGVPLDALTPPARARAEAVLGATVFAQRVAGIRPESREDVFRFLVDRPDFAASVARALRLGEYRVTARDDAYWGDDARGATGLIRVLLADGERRLYHLEGRYQKGIWPAIEGQLLVLLEFRHEADPEGGSRVEASLTGHLRVDTPLADAVTRLVGTVSRSLVERAVERKVRRFFRTVARVSRWAHDQPDLLAVALEGHPEVPQDETLAAFRAVLLAGRPPAWARVPVRLFPEAEAPVERRETDPEIDEALP
jgi:RNase P protein component